MFSHDDHMSIFGDTYHGVPGPQVLHDHPYPTRYHGPSYNYPYAGKPYRANPAAVAPFMGFGGVPQAAPTLGVTQDFLFKMGKPNPGSGVASWGLFVLPRNPGDDFGFLQLGTDYKQALAQAKSWTQYVATQDRKTYRILGEGGQVLFVARPGTVQRPMGGLGGCGCAGPRAGGADGLSGLSFAGGLGGMEALTASPTGSMVVDAFVGGIIGALMAKSSDDRLVWAGGGAVAAIVAGAIGLVGIVGAGAYVRNR